MRLLLAILLAPVPVALFAIFAASATRGFFDPGPFFLFYLGTLIILVVVGIPAHLILQKMSKVSIYNYAITGVMIPIPFTIIYLANNRLADNPWEVLIVHPMALVTAIFARLIIDRGLRSAA